MSAFLVWVFEREGVTGEGENCIMIALMYNCVMRIIKLGRARREPVGIMGDRNWKEKQV
jgi:hypothetical protein